VRIGYLLLLAAGAILVIYGSTATTAVASSFARLFATGSMDRAIWLFLGGGALFAVGLGGLVLRTRTFSREK
jgi:hypothetical protein